MERQQERLEILDDFSGDSCLADNRSTARPVTGIACGRMPQHRQTSPGQPPNIGPHTGRLTNTAATPRSVPACRVRNCAWLPRHRECAITSEPPSGWAQSPPEGFGQRHKFLTRARDHERLRVCGALARKWDGTTHRALRCRSSPVACSAQAFSLAPAEMPLASVTSQPGEEVRLIVPNLWRSTPVRFLSNAFDAGNIVVSSPINPDDLTTCAGSTPNRTNESPSLEPLLLHRIIVRASGVRSCKHIFGHWSRSRLSLALTFRAKVRSNHPPSIPASADDRWRQASTTR